MRLKALVSFCGTVSAGKGQEFSCSEDAARDLVAAGYACEIENKPEERECEGKPDNDTGNSGTNKRRRKVSN